MNPFQTNWTIKAKVINKKPIHIWNNEKSKGNLFSLDLLDSSGQIRITGFNNSVDKFYDQIENGAINFISNTDLRNQ